MTITKEIRDAKINALKDAFDDYVDKETGRIDRQITLLNSIKRGRGLGALQANVLTKLGDLAVTELNLYLGP